MARIRAILGALLLVFRRDSKSFGSFATNNFFLMSVLLLQRAGVFLYLIVGLVMFFPLSTDPLRKIPPSRLGLWPISTRERWLLRVASPWLNPLTWILAALAIWAARGKVTLGMWSALAAVFIIGFITPSLPLAPRKGAWHHIPNFPGPLNHLIRKNLRELLSTLDFYCALVLSVTVLAVRLASAKLTPDALLPMTVLVILALSSYAQSLFGLDGDQALTRYRLFPLRGWHMLAAKDAPFLLAALVLTLPLAPLAGMAAALAALAVGHASSVNERREQVRWRFSSGASFGPSMLQVVLLAGAAGTVQTYPMIILGVITAYIGSTWRYGRALERGLLES
jgi:hypothetical protein